MSDTDSDSEMMGECCICDREIHFEDEGYHCARCDEMFCYQCYFDPPKEFLALNIKMTKNEEQLKIYDNDICIYCYCPELDKWYQEKNE